MINFNDIFAQQTVDNSNNTAANNTAANIVKNDVAQTENVLQNSQQQIGLPTNTPKGMVFNGAQYQQSIGNTNTTSNSTSSGYKNVDENYNGYDPNKDPLLQLNLKYNEDSKIANRNNLKELQNLYERLTPDIVTPAKKDERLAGLTALAEALGGLGRAVGKAAGNNDGLGLVKTEDNNYFRSLYNNMLSAHGKRRAAELQHNLQQLQQNINMLTAQQQADKDARDNDFQARYNSLAKYGGNHTTFSSGQKANSSNTQNGENRVNTFIDPKSYKQQEEERKLKMQLLYQQINAANKKNSKTIEMSNFLWNNNLLVTNWEKGKKGEKWKLSPYNILKNGGIAAIQFDLNNIDDTRMIQRIYDNMKKENIFSSKTITGEGNEESNNSNKYKDMLSEIEQANRQAATDKDIFNKVMRAYQNSNWFSWIENKLKE